MSTSLSLPVVDAGRHVLEISLPVAGPDITPAAAEGWRMRLAHALRVATRDAIGGATAARPARLELSASLDGSDGGGGTALLRYARTGRVMWSSTLGRDDTDVYRIARAIRLALCGLD